MRQETRQIGDGTFASAVISAIRDLGKPKASGINPVPDGIRIDGKTCLVTGANSGLGRAAAIELARRGGNMILACRSGHVDTCDEIKRLSGSETVEMMGVDFADLESVHRFCDRLSQREVRIDIALMNAGLMPRRAIKTPQGYEVMFAVHFLSNRVMVDRWLQDGVLRPASQTGKIPRIIFVSSESHRSSHAIDFERFGAFADYGMKEGLKHYGLSKLILCTFATELSRRLNLGNNVEVAVHAICPGGVATNITRDAPLLLKPIINPALRLLFQTPEKAIGPAIYLCCAEAADKASGMYLHLMQRKSVSPAASDPKNGLWLWEASQVLVAKSRESV
ncbi:MAG: SDR family NAD(P)-dependent oxidoreductase [Gammaproteobacteria bacterium]|nr:SDR family NAD(P)-dependent oxidoreductase [Gammaproteobacteria bacterium]